MTEEPDDQQAPDWAVDQPQEADDDQPTGSIQASAPDWARDEAPGPQDQAGGVPDWASEGDTPGADNQDGAPQREQPAPGDKWSAPGSAAVGAATGIIPVGGAAAAGAYVGAATAPFITPVGGFLAGLGTFGLLNYLGESAQDKLLGIMGLDQTVKAAMEENPLSFEAGHMAPGLALGSPAGTLAARGIGAAVGGGGAAIMDATQGKVDPKNIAIGAGMGAAFPGMNNAGSKVLAAGEQMGKRIGGALYRGEGGRYRGGNTNPDVKEIPEESASPLDKAPQEDEITIAEDAPLVAPGVAQEQAPAPEIPGVGNPAGAPMLNRDAARPSDPSRNYQKDQAETQPSTTESKVIDTEPLKGDIKAALEGAEPAGEQVPHAEGTDVLPEAAAPTIQPEQDNHTPGVQQRAQIPESLGPEETSRAQRERVAEVQERMAASQKGEDYPNAIPSDHAVPEPEQAAKAPEALTPAEAKALAEDRKILAKHGWDRALAALDSVQPRRQLEAVRQAANEIRKGMPPEEAGVRRPDGELRKESRQKVGATGVVAASKAVAARKDAAAKGYQSIYDEFGPHSEKGKAIDPTDVKQVKGTREYTKQAWAEAVKRLGGDPFKKGSGIYVPQKRTDQLNEAVQWIKALRQSATGQNQKNFATLHSAPGSAALDRETGRVEGDIAHRPQLPEAGAEAETASDLGGSRTTFEHMAPDPRPNADNSYVEDHNALADWLNDRSPTEYAKLNDHYDLRAEMDEPADPRELMSDMKQSLADTGRRPKGEITTEVDLPAKSIKLPELPQKAQDAVDAGRSLKGTDEFKRLAALYNTEAPKGPAKSKAEQLEDLNAKQRSAAEAINGSTHEGLIDKVKQFVGDESGAGYLHRMFSQPANPSSPAALPAVKDYAEDLSGKFGKLTAETKNLKVEIMANLAKAADAKLTPDEHRQVSLAEQDNRIGALPQRLQDFYTEHVAPVRSRAMQVMRDFKDLNDTEKLGYELPNLNAVTTKAYQPRYQVDKQAFNRKDSDAFDPFTGRGMGDYAPNLEDRKFFAIENGGQRMVVEVTGDKDSGFGANVHRGPKNVSTLKNVPPSFSGQLGDTLNLNVKGQKGKWTMDQATTAEIEKATGLKYYENATWAWSRMLDDMSRAYENAKLTTEIKNDPEFDKLTTTDRKVAEANGWSTKVSTHLPDFATRNGKPLLMPDNMRWAFDDYHKPGFGGTTSEGIERLRNFNIALLKVFNTNAPLVHVLNELDLFTVGRGFKWISPKAYYNLAVSAPTAFKSVNMQDHLQAEMRSAGVNPMLASVGMRSMYETAAKNMGMEIMKDHSKWDPIAKLYGVSTKEIGQKLYDLSSDVTWRLSDYLTTMRYLEEKAGGAFGEAPKSPKDAAAKVNQFMSDYSMGTTVMGSRALQQMLTEPAVTAFGRYKGGVVRSISQMTRNLLSPNATKEERIEALGQWLVMGALGYVVYPAADALVKKVTGNEGGELRRRGISSFAEAAINVRSGEKDPVALAQRAWTPAPVASTAMDLVKNKDFAGKPIIPQGEWPGVLPEAAANAAEYAARTAVPPYGTLSQNYARPEGSVASGLGALAADQLGVGLPSDASQKRAGRIEKVNATAAKSRSKHPTGMIPDLMNRVTD